MGILVVGGILFGMILGRFFKWFVLIPASGARYRSGSEQRRANGEQPSERHCHIG